MAPYADFRLATAADAVPIARMSRDLIEQGLGWSWTPLRVARSIADRAIDVLLPRDAGALYSSWGGADRSLRGGVIQA